MLLKNIKKRFKEISILASIKILQSTFFNLVVSGSMLPQVEYRGWRCLSMVNTFAYGYKLPFSQSKLFETLPKRGDVILFHENYSKQKYLKRVIGLPGDVITLEGDKLYVNGQCITSDTDWEITSHYNSEHVSLLRAEGGSVELHTESLDGVTYYSQSRVSVPKQNFYNLQLQEGEIFVLGDNRDNSQDSRFLGPIYQSQIIGKVFFCFKRNI